MEGVARDPSERRKEKAGGRRLLQGPRAGPWQDRASFSQRAAQIQEKLLADSLMKLNEAGIGPPLPQSSPGFQAGLRVLESETQENVRSLELWSKEP